MLSLHFRRDSAVPSMTDVPETILEAARWMAREIGAYVFAVDHPDLPVCAGLGHQYVKAAKCPSRGKHNCVRYTLEATNSDREIVTEFAGATRNYGIFTRKSNLVVLDEDRPGELAAYVAERGQTLVETFEVTRGTSGRRHYYFAAPRGVKIGNADLCPGVNVRAGADGYVVGPLSKHPSGELYLATWDRRPAPLPGWLADVLVAKATLAAGETIAAAETLDRPLPGWLMDRLTDDDVPDRSGRFHSLVGGLRSAGFTPGQAVTVLEPWCVEQNKYVGRVAREVARSWGKVTPPTEQAPAPSADAGTADAPESRQAAALARELAEQRIRREARAILDREARPAVRKPEVLTLRERLARPRDPAVFRIEGWQPEGARVILAAQFKAGKTTATGNLARSVLDGDPWLGQYAVKPVTGTLVTTDFEMSSGQLDDWLGDQRIVNDDRLIPIPLRGNAAAFDILDLGCRAEWAAELRRLACSYLVWDCLRPVLDALGLDEHRDAGRLLVAFDALLADAGIGEAAIVHHMGHTGERSRGDSRIRDWPDVEWRLVRQDDEPGSPRFISAYGRDVDVAESQLSFDPETRRLSIVGGSRTDAAALAALSDVMRVIGDQPGLSGRRIEEEMAESPHTQKSIRAALKMGIRRGAIVTTPGPRGAHLHSQRVSALDLVETASTRSSECVSASIEDALHSDADDDPVRQPHTAPGPACSRCGQRLITKVGIARGICVRCEPGDKSGDRP